MMDEEKIITANLTQAHHQLGDLLNQVRYYHYVVRLEDGNRKEPVAYLVPPEKYERFMMAISKLDKNQQRT